jgi:hypothetical protein
MSARDWSGWALLAGALGAVAWVVFPLAPAALVAADLGRRRGGVAPRRRDRVGVIVGYVGGALGVCFGIGLVVHAVAF